MVATWRRRRRSRMKNPKAKTIPWSCFVWKENVTIGGGVGTRKSGESRAGRWRNKTTTGSGSPWLTQHCDLLDCGWCCWLVTESRSFTSSSAAAVFSSLPHLIGSSGFIELVSPSIWLSDALSPVVKCCNRRGEEVPEETGENRTVVVGGACGI